MDIDKKLLALYARRGMTPQEGKEWSEKLLKQFRLNNASVPKGQVTASSVDESVERVLQRMAATMWPSWGLPFQQYLKATSYGQVAIKAHERLEPSDKIWLYGWKNGHVEHAVLTDKNNKVVCDAFRMMGGVFMKNTCYIVDVIDSHDASVVEAFDFLRVVPVGDLADMFKPSLRIVASLTTQAADNVKRFLGWAGFEFGAESNVTAEGWMVMSTETDKDFKDMDALMSRHGFKVKSRNRSGGGTWEKIQGRNLTSVEYAFPRIAVNCGPIAGQKASVAMAIKPVQLVMANSLADAKAEVTKLVKKYNAYVKENPGANKQTGYLGNLKDEILLAKKKVQKAQRGQS